jgi:hypothetical protein
MTMRADEVVACLLKRWPSTEYVSVEEAPTSADRQGRKLDLLVASLWRSRGFELDGIEIKVSLSDWKRELVNAEKADWWWRHVHRFWMAVPADIAFKVREDLPTGWGLLSCGPVDSPERTAAVIVKPAQHEAQPMPWSTVLGLLCASGAGFNALQRAEQHGYERGREVGEKEAQLRSSDDALREKYEKLYAKVEAFQETSGLDIEHLWEIKSAANLGRLANLVIRHGAQPERVRESLLYNARQIEHLAQTLDKAAAEMEWAT